MIIIVIEFIDYPDPEGARIGETAKINAGNIQVFGESHIALRFKECIGTHEAFADKLPVLHIIRNRFPQTVFSMLVFQWNGIGHMQQIAVRHRQPDLPSMLFEVIAQRVSNRKNGFLRDGFRSLSSVAKKFAP